MRKDCRLYQLAVNRARRRREANLGQRGQARLGLAERKPLVRPRFAAGALGRPGNLTASRNGDSAITLDRQRARRSVSLLVRGYLERRRWPAAVLLDARHDLRARRALGTVGVTCPDRLHDGGMTGHLIALPRPGTCGVALTSRGHDLD